MGLAYFSTRMGSSIVANIVMVYWKDAEELKGTMAAPIKALFIKVSIMELGFYSTPNKEAWVRCLFIG